jgi:UDP-N-acetylmuramate dehydrogenase
LHLSGPSTTPPSLSDLTTLRLGGPSSALVTADDEQGLIEVARAADGNGEPLLLVGGGSNLVVADDGFDGTALQVATSGVIRTRQPDDKVLLEVAAGESWENLVRTCCADGLSGIEALAGIPGTVGGTPIQNVGAYGQEVAETILGVRAYDRLGREIIWLSPPDCVFGYRRSVFQADPDRFVILSVNFALRRSRESGPLSSPEVLKLLRRPEGAAAPLTEIRDAVLHLRAAKGMVLDQDDHDTWSVGSFFKNPVLSAENFARLQAIVAERHGADDDVPHRTQDDGQIRPAAGWLIENAGFPKGYPLVVHPKSSLAARPDSPVSLSTKHAMALTNRGSGTTRQLLGLAREVANSVERTYGVTLTPEPVFVGARWRELASGPLPSQRILRQQRR